MTDDPNPMAKIPLEYAPPEVRERPSVFTRVLSGVLMVGSLPLLVIAAAVRPTPGRVDFLVYGLNALIWGLAIRFAHVDLLRRRRH